MAISTTNVCIMHIQCGIVVELKTCTMKSV